MAAARASSLALVHTLEEPVTNTTERVDSDADVRERRAHARIDPMALPDPLVARVKYGDSVTLVDVSAGGALIETSAALRPDSTLVLEMMPAGAQDPMSVVARIVRCQVASVNGGIRYRGACAFKRPLDYPPLVEPMPPVATAAAPAQDAFSRPEFALKAIVEGYRRRVRSATMPGARPDSSAVVESLRKLHESTEQRIDPIDRCVAQMLGAVVPALQRNESPDVVMGEVLVQLARHVPAMTIRVGGGSRPAAPGDAERITLNVWSEPADRATLTAEFPSGFDIGEEHFRVLKVGAYLLGLAESWTPAAPSLVVVPPPAPAIEDDREIEEPLPAGWQRVVIRFADGELLRGYTNTFHPDNAHLYLSPTLDTDPRERLLVPIARLKAVFFVRHLAGNAEHVDSNAFDHNPRARKLEVTFRDGEVMAGSTLNYKPDGQGFFLLPANTRGNNQRVYVVLASVRHLRFL